MTRAEIRQLETLERTPGGAGLGVGSSLLSSSATGFVGSMVAQSFFSAIDGIGHHGDTAADDGATAMNDEPDHDADADYDGDGGDFDV